MQANNAALTAANASLVAAVEEIKKQGFTGLNIPDLPKPVSQSAPDPVKTLTDTIMKGFSQMGQTMNAVNRYQRVFGQPIPEDPATIADRAANARLSVNDYVEQTYKVSAKEKEISDAAAQKSRDDYAATKIEEYKAAHPITAGHPDLNGGTSSNYPKHSQAARCEGRRGNFRQCRRCKRFRTQKLASRRKSSRGRTPRRKG